MLNSNDKTEFIENIFDKIPVPIFLVNEEMEIIGLNTRALKLGEKEREFYYHKRAGNALSCIHSFEHIEGCGNSKACSECVVRNTFKKAMKERKEYQEIEKMFLVRENKEKKAVDVLVTASPFDYEGDRFIIITLEDIGELLHLKQLIPICANCKKIRDDKDFWQSVESYIERFTDFTFSHGICPDCMQDLYPEYVKRKKK